MTIQLETSRLILRAWQDSDLKTFHEMSQDQDVMRYFPQRLTAAESQRLARLIQSFIEQQGWGFWALELKETGEFLGFTGLHHQPTKFEFSPCTEIGWRLKRSAWRQGYAYEAAVASLSFGFNNLRLDQIVAFTASLNHPSKNLMQRLDMSEINSFEHPDVDENSPLKQHILYAITAAQFMHHTNDWSD